MENTQNSFSNIHKRQRPSCFPKKTPEYQNNCLTDGEDEIASVTLVPRAPSQKRGMVVWGDKKDGGKAANFYPPTTEYASSLRTDAGGEAISYLLREMDSCEISTDTTGGEAISYRFQLLNSEYM